MAQMTIRINGYAYTVGCEDGQEPHLEKMAQDIEQRIASIKAMTPLLPTGTTSMPLGTS